MAKKKAVSKPALKPAPPTDDIAALRPTKPRVQANAKKARVAASGLTSRVRGHVAARTKRSQAKRDANQAKRRGI